MDENSDSAADLVGSTTSSPDASNPSIPTPPLLSQRRSASQPASPKPTPRLAPISSSTIPLAPPPPPPPPPLTVTSFNAPPSPTSASTMPSFVGSLDMLQRAALRQTKWPLVLILPPAHGPTTVMPPPMQAPPSVASSVMLWRRVSTSADAQRYTNFFPVDGLPHLALLDPRSGERLAVWGNDDDPTAMADHALAPHVWDAVMDDVAEFLPLHSLDDGKLGPVHRAEKPWAVRTRRVSASASAQQSTAILDDEEAAMAAAIAASIADMEASSNQASNTDDQEFDDVDDDEDDDVEDVEDDEDDGTSNDMNSNTDVESIAPSTSPMMPTAVPVPSSPVPTPCLSGATSQLSTPIRVGGPSSVESLSSSYLDRMASCLRSSADPALAERRRLREEQDAELQEALLKDRAKADATARAEASVRDAAARLPAEPAEEDPTTLCIAMRLPDGKRLARRFPPYAKVRALADLVAASNVPVPGAAFSKVAAVFSSPGLDLSAATWDMTLAELKLSRRSMFLLQR